MLMTHLVFISSIQAKSKRPLFEEGKEAAENGNPVKAIAIFKEYLRRKPKDQEAWHELAASYYQVGLPKKALEILELFADNEGFRSRNLYYQGLCYKSLKKFNKSRKFLTKAARYQDINGAHAQLNIALLEYQLRFFQPARFWLRQFLRSFPKNAHRKKAKILLSKIRNRVFDPEFTFFREPHREMARYKYHPRSLFPFPHYWFYEFGYRFHSGSIKNPTFDERGRSTYTDEFYGNHSLLGAAGIGLGPIIKSRTRSFVGYHYFQSWLSDLDRMDTYTKDPLDLAFFPFRPDLLLRKHQLYGSLASNDAKTVHFGLIGQYELHRLGSRIFPGSAIRAVLNLTNTRFLMPWLRFSWAEFSNTTVYALILKELNRSAKELSFKTYHFFTPFKMSGGFRHHQSVRTWGLNFSLNLFRLNLTFNDIWLDLVRTGYSIKGQKLFKKGIDITAGFSSFSDDYRLGRLRRGNCGSASTDSSVVFCRRTDQQSRIEVGAHWAISSHRKATLVWQSATNTSDLLEVFNSSHSQFLVKLSWFFPDPLGDSSLTEELDLLFSDLRSRDANR